MPLVSLYGVGLRTDDVKHSISSVPPCPIWVLGLAFSLILIPRFALTTGVFIALSY
jgi:hypothetical protein